MYVNMYIYTYIHIETNVTHAIKYLVQPVREVLAGAGLWGVDPGEGL
jgi:hypothetical protein